MSGRPSEPPSIAHRQSAGRSARAAEGETRERRQASKRRSKREGEREGERAAYEWEFVPPGRAAWDAAEGLAAKQRRQQRRQPSAYAAVRRRHAVEAARRSAAPSMAAARTVFPLEAKLRQMVAAGDMSQQEFDSLLAGGNQ